MLKHQLQSLVEQSLNQLIEDGDLQCSELPTIQIDRTKQRDHGDYSCNIAMVMARIAKRAPRDLATMIVAALPASELVERVELAGPGFINFFLTPTAMQSVVHDILTAGDDFGHTDIGADQKVIIEFVSANPTGPLHVGHGRGAAYGDALARVLRAAGYDVHTEYYVNDAGRQMNILAVSVWLRYLELCGEEFDFPANGYQGDYVWDIAASIHRARENALQRPVDDVFVGVPPDEPLGGDKEEHIDGLIHRARELLGDDDYMLVFNQGLDEITDNIRRDLAEFGVEYDRWYSERSLHEIGEVDKAISKLTEGGYIYEQDGAKWFRSTDFGDEKDMSTRSGEFVTLRELRNEVGNDAARFFYVMRKTEQHMDFDLDLAKSESSDNPVYYVQYAHARICSVMGQLAERGYKAEGLASTALDSLTEEHETELLNQLSHYPEVIESAARQHEPHQLAYYLRELANAFHTYYNSHQFLVEDESLRDARLALIVATRHVLAGGLNLLGVSAPETM